MPPGTKSKAPKPVFRTDIPFTETVIPQVPPQDHDIILDLLYNLLEPLGQHRKTHITPSKGKKRKRASHSTISPPPPPPPELSNHLTLGLNSTTRHLTSLAALSAPPTVPAARNATSQDPNANNPNSKETNQDSKAEANRPKPLTTLFIPHQHPPSSLLHAHIPTLLHLASLACPSAPPPRLVLLSSNSESKLAEALHIPRIGAIGIIEGAPGSDTLVEYVREKVGTVDVPWIEEARKGVWRGTKIIT